MRFLTLAMYFALFAAAASGQKDTGQKDTGQQDRGTIAGSVSDPFGMPYADAPVQARNTGTGSVYKTSSSATGGYTLTDLPDGSYDVSVAIPGLRTYAKKGVDIEGSRTAPLDIRLQEGSQLSTLGEDTLAIVADRKKHAPPTGPAPRMLSGKPDLSGIWWSPRTVDPGKPEFLPQAVAVAKQRADNNRRDSPQVRCLPAPVVRLGPVYETVQSPEVLVVISDDDSPGFHQIYVDGRPHRKDPDPTWYGDSVGRWEGDTLVVDRIAFNDSVWLDQEAHPHSD